MPVPAVWSWLDRETVSTVWDSRSCSAAIVVRRRERCDMCYRKFPFVGDAPDRRRTVVVVSCVNSA